MRAHLGIAIARDVVRMVLVRSGRIHWTIEESIGSDQPIERRLELVLEQVPKLRGPRPYVGVAAGADAAHVKQIEGLPVTDDQSSVNTIVQENVHAFMAIHPGKRLIARVRQTAPNVWMAIMVDATVIDAVAAVCRSRGFIFRQIAPTAALIATSVTDGTFIWQDDRVCWEVTATDDTPLSIRARRADDAVHGPQSRPASTLEPLGDRAVHFADAFAAAQFDRHVLTIDPDTIEPWYAPRYRGRYVRPFGAIVAAALLFLTSPFGATIAHHRADQQLAAISSDRWREISATSAALDTLDVVLSAIRSFADSARPGFLSDLVAITAALPGSSAVISLNLDETHANLEILTTDTSSLYDRFRRLVSTIEGKLEITERPETDQGGAHRLQARIAFSNGQGLHLLSQ